MQCMNIEDHLNKTQPKNFAKTSSNLKNPKIFQKPQKLDKKRMKCMIDVRRKIIPEEENTLEAKDWVGKTFRERERKVVWGGEKSKTIERDWRKWEKIVLRLYIETYNSRWIERCREVLSTNLDRWSYRGAIERCPQQSDLDGLRSY